MRKFLTILLLATAFACNASDVAQPTREISNIQDGSTKFKGGLSSSLSLIDEENYVFNPAYNGNYTQTMASDWPSVATDGLHKWTLVQNPECYVASCVITYPVHVHLVKLDGTTPTTITLTANKETTLSCHHPGDGEVRCLVWPTITAP